MLAQTVYIACTALCIEWCLCTRRLAYILHESWLLGVFHIYLYDSKTSAFGVCSLARHMHCKLPLASVRVVYTRNTPCNHDLYIIYSSNTCTDSHGPTHEVKGVHTHTYIHRPMYVHTYTYTCTCKLYTIHIEAHTDLCGHTKYVHRKYTHTHVYGHTHTHSCIHLCTPTTNHPHTCMYTHNCTYT